jgi:hypothetical protein
MKQSNPEKPIRAKTVEDLGRALGLSEAETGEMEFRSELACAPAKIIHYGNLRTRKLPKRQGPLGLG